MESVSIVLKQAWPTEQGTRRPQEGVIVVSQSDAEAIVEAGAGEIVASDVPAEPPAPSRRAKPRAKPAAAPAAAPPEQSEPE